jgi:hypothetical protein
VNVRRTFALAALCILCQSPNSAGATPSSGGCEQALPHAPASLPAAVVVTTPCGRFRLDPGGDVTFQGQRTSPVPAIATVYWPRDLTWYGVDKGHIVIGRGLERLWTSRRSYPRARFAVGVVVLGRRKLAFSYLRRGVAELYLARYGRGERTLARGEAPMTFVASGQLVTLRHGWLLLRAGNGRVVRTLARHAVDAQVGGAAGSVYFRAGSRLFMFDGVCVRQLTSLRRLGFSSAPMVEPLGPLVVVRDERRLVVLNTDGRMVASTPLPVRPRRADGVSSPVVANESGTAVAFTATNGNTAYGSPGHETVYVLASGSRQARPVFTEALQFQECERMASLAWRGQWLLYSATEQRAAVIATSGNELSVDLDAVIAQLPGAGTEEAAFDVSWP